jgi:hypothetical protein
MSTETAERLRALLEQRDQSSEPVRPAGIGARFTDSPVFRSAREGQSGTVRVADADEVPGLLRTRDAGHFELSQTTHAPAYVKPRSIRLLDLVRVVEADSDSLFSVQETARVADSGTVEPETLLPSVTSISTSTPSTSRLFLSGVSADLPRSMLDDKGQAAAFVETVMLQTWKRLLEGEMLSGDGSTVAGRVKQLGITNTTGVETFAKTTGTNGDALAEGVAAIRENEFGIDAPPVVVIHPRSLQIARAETLPLRDVLGDDVVIVPSNAVALGSAVVGDWFAGATLWTRGALELDVSYDHADFLLKGLAALRLTTQLRFLCQHPSAFCSVTGLAA